MTKYLVKNLAKCKTFPPKCILLGKKAHERCSVSVIRKIKLKAQGNINTFFLQWVKFKRLAIPNVSENLKQNSHALLIEISKDTVSLAEKKNRTF